MAEISKTSGRMGNPRNAVMANSLRSRLRGWRDTYAPKNQSVKVVDWLRENKFHVSEDEANDMGNMTFADVKREGIESLGWLDTFLRDAVYDGANSLTRKRTR
ncbi:MAG: hypothetical protein ACI3YI_13020 [Bacteroidaceae bacterium]